MLRWLRETPARNPIAGWFSAMLGMCAVMLPGIFLGFTTPMMHAVELGIGLLLMGGAAFFGYLVGVRRPLWGWAGVPVGVAIVSASFWFTCLFIRDAKVAALREQLPEYLGLDPGDEKIRQGGMPYIRPKVVAINRVKKDIDPLHHMLPDKLRADRPEEVRTVVWLEWVKELVGETDDGTPAYSTHCDISVIDNVNPPLLVARTRIRGESPLGGSSEDSSLGRPLYQEIIRYLQGLAR